MTALWKSVPCPSVTECRFWDGILTARHCSLRASLRGYEAIPNYTERRDRCTTCIASLPIGDCFVAHSLQQWRLSYFGVSRHPMLVFLLIIFW